MSDFDNFEFDPVYDDEEPGSEKDFFSFDDDSSSPAPDKITKSGTDNSNNLSKSARKRTSADFSPDMDLLLLTAQSSMILEGMKLVSQHDFKSGNVTAFAEAVRGADLYIKIIQRNPANYKKLSAMLTKDIECMEVQKITFNLYKSVYDELPESDSQKLKAFELIRDTLQNAHCKSLISLSLIEIKKYFLMTGDPDYSKIENVILNEKDKGAAEFLKLEKHVDMARKLLKTGNFEINKGMKGREINVFIMKASLLLTYYYSETNFKNKSVFYNKLHDNFKKYFVVK